MIMKLSPDGLVEVGSIQNDDCCLFPLSHISRDALGCAFVGLLPSGPLWDYSKEQIAQDAGIDSCVSMARYARFIGHRLYDLLINVLWSAIRESNPQTAVTTLPDWINKLGFVDCYGSCRNMNLANLSPLEIMTECGPELCVTDFGEDYTKAYQSAIIRSIERIKLVMIPPNLAAVNYVLEPLGAKIIPDHGAAPSNGCSLDKICLKLQKKVDVLPLPQEDIGAPATYINSWLDLGCDRPAGLPQYIWPNLPAAECIVRSMISNRKLCLNVDNCSEPE